MNDSKTTCTAFVNFSFTRKEAVKLKGGNVYSNLPFMFTLPNPGDTIHDINVVPLNGSGEPSIFKIDQDTGEEIWRLKFNDDNNQDWYSEFKLTEKETSRPYVVQRQTGSELGIYARDLPWTEWPALQATRWLNLLGHWCLILGSQAGYTDQADDHFSRYNRQFLDVTSWLEKTIAALREKGFTVAREEKVKYTVLTK